MTNMQQRSTKGASKQRREMINGEIVKIRDLLPVAESVRSRLSQLQVMSFCNAYVGKCSVFENIFPADNSRLHDLAKAFQLSEISELLPGFLMMMTLEGKVLYLSENVLEYLGHSMVDILTHVDTIYDLIESSDRNVVKEVLDGFKSGVHLLDEWSFVCRMGLTKKLHQNLGISDQKLMQVRGWFRIPQFSPDFQNPVFMGLCTPRLNAGLASDPRVLSDTMVYETLHGPDMKYLDISRTGEAHLGYSREEIYSRSWYEIIHPDDLHRAVSAHKNLIYCESESKSPLFIRMQTKDGRLIWVCVLLSKVRNADGEDRYICINQVITEQEAMQELPAGLDRDMFLSFHGDVSVGFPKENEFSMKSRNDLPLSKCGGREEILRRLKRKMEMNEIQRKKSLLSCSSTPDPRSCTPPASRGDSNIFNFDVSCFQKNKIQSFSCTTNPIKTQVKVIKTSLDNDQFECDNSSSYSCFSPCSNSVFPTVSPVPAVHSYSPVPFSLKVSCPQDEGMAFITSMPTPEFVKESLPSNAESFEGGISDEEEEVVNIVEEMMEGKPFCDEVQSIRTGQELARQKQTYELPILCPGTVDEFFREVGVVNSASCLDTSVEFEKLNAANLATFELNSSLSAGQISAELYGLCWGSTKAREVAEPIVERTWSEWDKRGVPSALKESWYDAECQMMTSDYIFNCNKLSHSANDLPWDGLSNLMMVDYDHWY